MDASVVFCVVCQTYTYYTTEAFLWDFVHRYLRTRFSPALLGVWDCFNQCIVYCYGHSIPQKALLCRYVHEWRFFVHEKKKTAILDDPLIDEKYCICL